MYIFALKKWAGFYYISNINSDYFQMVRIQTIFFYIKNFQLFYDKNSDMENKFTDQVYRGQVDAIIL